VTELIGFRVLQGLGGGMIMPVGQAILARAAGPQQMGRVMSIIGVPLLLGPVVGPVIGGVLVSGASWRWIFFVNLPVGAAALALALRLLPDTPRRPTKLDLRGLVLLSGGIAVFLYGLAKVGDGGTAPLATMAAGLALVAAFCWHALRARQPLLDIRLLRRRGFAAGAAANLMLGIALFGVALLLPLYLEIIRSRTPLQTGLLLIPQGLGAALAMPAAGALTDRIGARPVVTGGIVVALAGLAGYTQIAATTAYWYLAAALLLIGIGMGATITPAMAAAFQSIERPAIGAATATIGTIQRIAGSLGTALLAIYLAARHGHAPARLPRQHRRGGRDRRRRPGTGPPRPGPSVRHDVLGSVRAHRGFARARAGPATAPACRCPRACRAGAPGHPARPAQPRARRAPPVVAWLP
jgi:EmrB/QacA subfamily drug resistance transporter